MLTISTFAFIQEAMRIVALHTSSELHNSFLTFYGMFFLTVLESYHHSFTTKLYKHGTVVTEKVYF